MFNKAMGIIGLMLALVNFAFYFAGDHHWYNLASGLFVGIVGAISLATVL